MKPAYLCLKPILFLAKWVLFCGCEPLTHSITDEESIELPAKSETSLKSRPNIVFIFSDDHSYEAVSAYGGRLSQVAPTPNLDRIAKEDSFRQLFCDQCTLWSKSSGYSNR